MHINYEHWNTSSPVKYIIYKTWIYIYALLLTLRESATTKAIVFDNNH